MKALPVIPQLINPPYIKVDPSVFQKLSVLYQRDVNVITVVGDGQRDDAWIYLCSVLAHAEGHLLNHSELNIYFRLSKINGASAKYIFKIIQRLNVASKAKQQVRIFWSCHSEYEAEMHDLGEDFRQFCEFPFEVSYL